MSQFPPERLGLRKVLPSTVILNIWPCDRNETTDDIIYREWIYKRNCDVPSTDTKQSFLRGWEELNGRLIALSELREFTRRVGDWGDFGSMYFSPLRLRARGCGPFPF